MAGEESPTVTAKVVSVSAQTAAVPPVALPKRATVQVAEVVELVRRTPTRTWAGLSLSVSAVMLLYSGAMLHESLSSASEDTTRNWPLFMINAVLNLTLAVAVGMLGYMWTTLEPIIRVASAVFAAIAFVYSNAGILNAVMTPNNELFASVMVVISAILVGIFGIGFLASTAYLVSGMRGKLPAGTTVDQRQEESLKPGRIAAGQAYVKLQRKVDEDIKNYRLATQNERAEAKKKLEANKLESNPVEENVSVQNNEPNDSKSNSTD